LRGIGSIYYLMYAAENGLPDDLVRTLTGLTFGVIAASVVVHGISVLPVLRFLQSGQRRRREKDRSESRL
jgi:NhaP-type Na+/H+ or K+/H+ antiporter